MDMGKTLRDIRFYTSEESNYSGKGIPSDCSGLLHYPTVLNCWGGRIAQRLESDSFSLGDFDHLYINFTCGIPDGEFRFADRATEKWMRYVDVGVNFDSLREFDEDTLEKFLIERALNSLLFLSKGDTNKARIVENLREEITKHGTDIEIRVKEKLTRTYSVLVTYKLRPNGLESYGLVEYIDVKSGNGFKTKFVDLLGSDDIFFLVGSITIKNGCISIKPRTSFRASLFTENYDVPIEIKIGDYLNA